MSSHSKEDALFAGKIVHVWVHDRNYSNHRKERCIVRKELDPYKFEYEGKVYSIRRWEVVKCTTGKVADKYARSFSMYLFGARNGNTWWTKDDHDMSKSLKY